jgi:hypothetical protein
MQVHIAQLPVLSNSPSQKDITHPNTSHSPANKFIMPKAKPEQIKININMYETKEVLIKKASRQSRNSKHSKGIGVMTTNNSKDVSPG